MKNILILGGGSIGKRHLKNLLSLGEREVSVVEINSERAKEVEEEFSVSTYTSLESAFNEKNFDICFVCSPSIYHIDQAMFCAEKGADLFIEKPLSHTMDGVEKFIAIVKEKNLITMVGSNWKFYPLFQKMKEILESGVLGEVLSARCQFGQYLPDWHPWEDYRKGYSANKKLGGGILLDSHEFDYLSWFMGPVKKLACFSEKVSNLEIDVEDVAEVILKFESGAIGEIHLDYVQRFYRREFEFFGENGTLSWSMPEKKVVLETKEKGKEEFILPENYDLNEMYVEQTKHFLECVEKKVQTITAVEYGANVVKLICAAKESSESGKAINF